MKWWRFVLRIAQCFVEVFHFSSSPPLLISPGDLHTAWPVGHTTHRPCEINKNGEEMRCFNQSPIEEVTSPGEKTFGSKTRSQENKPTSYRSNIYKYFLSFLSWLNLQLSCWSRSKHLYESGLFPVQIHTQTAFQFKVISGESQGIYFWVNLHEIGVQYHILRFPRNAHLSTFKFHWYQEQ